MIVCAVKYRVVEEIKYIWYSNKYDVWIKIFLCFFFFFIIASHTVSTMIYEYGLHLLNVQERLTYYLLVNNNVILYSIHIGSDEFKCAVSALARDGKTGLFVCSVLLHARARDITFFIRQFDKTAHCLTSNYTRILSSWSRACRMLPQRRCAGATRPPLGWCRYQR